MPGDTSEHGSNMKTRKHVCEGVRGCKCVHGAAHHVPLCVRDGLAAHELGCCVYTFSPQRGDEETLRRATVWICSAIDTCEPCREPRGNLSLCTCGATPPRPGVGLD